MPWTPIRDQPVQRNWTELNQTEKDAYILRRYGPKQYEQNTAVPMTVFYLVLFVAGVPGNLLTCLIILWNSYMRAPPNFFLFNLAIVDIITLTMGKINVKKNLDACLGSPVDHPKIYSVKR